MQNQSWMREWDPVVESIGSDLLTHEGTDPVGADPVDLSSIRRWCEPLEFACELHEDKDTAVGFGFADVIAPYTAIASFALPPVWGPGRSPVFEGVGRDAQPARSPVAAIALPDAPRTSGFFATEVENTYLRPVVVGDRVRRASRRLVACVPKQTRVGRGAFVTIESTLVDQHDEPVAINRSTYFYYSAAQETASVHS
ncbi:FAS1-like dehydratase domain-containing protein [Rhodococcus opacus]|uniref:FAS1-like dehydratase domain-containing protein n=1 Tax=Rhodococcus opacus TaxID=37919 RepID=UPI00294A7AFD|nr:MaoC family dehydratase N-terminal domain-containing protein [Rhodococcus opacus]MDV6245361.1 MaoC family dehydratase N-terminal domain-containing protein [Rhodococcus opacus]